MKELFSFSLTQTGDVTASLRWCTTTLMMFIYDDNEEDDDECDDQDGDDNDNDYVDDD